MQGNSSAAPDFDPGDLGSTPSSPDCECGDRFGALHDCDALPEFGGEAMHPTEEVGE